MVRNYFTDDEAETETREVIAQDPKLARGSASSGGRGSCFSAPCCVILVPILDQEDGQ